ncbi:class I SAM-dependent methyltransferase [Neolewinella antarctica]|uniref:Ubiquinone/menaquinone biosynthesis C-methylase UbiE n=1 Tax=Neolewinella antarctica TaxID=442734 RepID=A0ABX0X9Q9_9BACT|nr:class I SAM-dependent methyltransferase [Neolewinella antarctica]NJC26003.1 ubiquinone/menaquinone biosynthesis C-methylase UbiE [Neolewinella antarctica]
MSFRIDRVLKIPRTGAEIGAGREPIDRLPVSGNGKASSAAHEAHGSDFDYLDHYERDAHVFDYFATSEDPATVQESVRLHQTILERIPAGTTSVLDVGCGSAWVAAALTARGITVVSFDIASANLNKALARVPSEHHVAVRGDVLSLPFKDESFDVVISSEVIEHVPYLPGYLDNVLRVLKPGGRAILTTPYDEKIQYSLCIHCNRSTPQHAHLHSFREDSLDNLMAAHPGVGLRAFTSANKALVYLRGYTFTQHLSFELWKLVDGLANWLLRKPGRLTFLLDKQVTSGL